MEPADSIARLGFARWYERRLIEAHAWFISAFVCVVAIAACAEELAFRGTVARLRVYVTGSLGAAATARRFRCERHVDRRDHWRRGDGRFRRLGVSHAQGTERSADRKSVV